MINFDYLTLKAFMEENIDFLIDSRLQKIQQPTRRDFLLSFRNRSDSKKMYININPTYFNLCFTTDENIKKRIDIFNNKNGIKTKVVCDNIIFNSIADCAIYLKDNQNNISRYLRGKRRMPKKYIERGLAYA